MCGLKNEMQLNIQKLHEPFDLFSFLNTKSAFRLEKVPISEPKFKIIFMWFLLGQRDNLLNVLLQTNEQVMKIP